VNCRPAAARHYRNLVDAHQHTRCLRYRLVLQRCCWFKRLVGAVCAYHRSTAI
jgi:hypothetical protein